MKSIPQKIFLTVVILGLLSSFSCTRSEVEYPGPTGPSTLALILQMSAAPNVVYAGVNRQDTVVNATLKKFDGSPYSNETIYFEVRNETGSRIDVGFLDGSQSVATKVTDSSGAVSITYTSPTADELVMANLGAQDDFKIMIYAYVAWQGKEIISEWTPIVIVKDIFDITGDISFELQAIPNVLWCDSTPPQSEIRGIFLLDGQPITNRRVYFKILSGPGKFADGFAKTFAETDANGVATVTYLGPTKDQLSYDSFVTIDGQPETSWIHIYDPTYDPDSPGSYDYLHKSMELRLIKGHD